MNQYKGSILYQQKAAIIKIIGNNMNRFIFQLKNIKKIDIGTKMKSFIKRLAFSCVTSLCLAAQVNFAVAQTAALLPNALQQFFDNNGNPLSGGSVTFYIPNTTTLNTVWADSSESVPWANPLTLDAGGKPTGSGAGIYGQGTYRQIVKDKDGNTIWDANTSASGSGGSPILIGDGQAVGTVKPWAGVLVPSQYAFAAGQTLLRTTYSALLSAITLQTTVSCTSGNNTLNGIGDTSQIPIGAPVEIICMAPGSTVVSKTSSSITLNNPSSLSLNAVATIFPYGDGDGATTFNVPDLRGYVIAGNDSMGGSAANRFSTYFGTNTPDATGAVGGSASTTLVQGNLPAIAPTFTGTLHTWSGSLTQIAEWGGNTLLNGGGGSNVPAAGNMTDNNTDTIAVTPAGTISNLGSSTPFSTVQPTITLNYIIKILPDVSISNSTVVTSINGMMGSISCAQGLTCATLTGVNTLECSIATTSILGCVKPDGTTILINGSGVLSTNGSAGGIVGPVSSTIGDVAIWSNGAGSALADGGTLRIRLSNSLTTFYVNGNSVSTATCGIHGTGAPLTCSAGNDNNTCLSPSQACLTAQHVVNLIFANYDTASNSIQVNLAHGSSTNYAFNCLAGALLGNVTFDVIGDLDNPTAATIIAPNTTYGIFSKDGCSVSLDAVAIADQGSAAGGLFVANGALPGGIDVRSTTFTGTWNASSSLIIAANGGTINMLGADSSGVTNTINSTNIGGDLFQSTIGGFINFAGQVIQIPTAFVIGQYGIYNVGGFVDGLVAGNFLNTGTFQGAGAATVTGNRCLAFDAFWNALDPNTAIPGNVNCPMNRTFNSATITGPLTGGGIWTLPAGTDTIVGRATTDTFTNKTIGGNLLSSGTAPTCAATGIGSTGTCGLATGSNDFAGLISLTVGGSGISDTGTITLTLNASLGTNDASCEFQSASGTGTWTAPVTFTNTTLSKTAPIFTWFNASTNLTTADVYNVNYHCIGY